MSPVPRDKGNVFESPEVTKLKQERDEAKSEAKKLRDSLDKTQVIRTLLCAGCPLC